MRLEFLKAALVCSEGEYRHSICDVVCNGRDLMRIEECPWGQREMDALLGLKKVRGCLA